MIIFVCRAKCKHLEMYNKELFIRFISMGRSMLEYATSGDIKNFKRQFLESVDKEILYWHITKSLKAAIKAKKLEIIEFIIEDLDTPLYHEAFEGQLHHFVFGC